MGCGELAHCARRNLFSMQLEAIHLLIRLIFELSLCKSLGNKFTENNDFSANAKCEDLNTRRIQELSFQNKASLFFPSFY